MSYAPGESVPLLLDIVPARITPLPPGVPHGPKLRVVVTERLLTVLWQGAGGIGRVDLDMTPEQTGGTMFMGGQVAGYDISRAGGCSCGVTSLQRYDPFPDVTFVATPRRDPVYQPTVYGVPPQRWSRG